MYKMIDNLSIFLITYSERIRQDRINISIHCLWNNCQIGQFYCLFFCGDYIYLLGILFSCFDKMDFYYQGRMFEQNLVMWKEHLTSLVSLWAHIRFWKMRLVRIRLSQIWIESGETLESWCKCFVFVFVFKFKVWGYYVNSQWCHMAA